MLTPFEIEYTVPAEAFETVNNKLTDEPLQTVAALEVNVVVGNGTTVTVTGEEVTGLHGALVTLNR